MYKERKEKNTLQNKSSEEALNRNHRAYNVHGVLKGFLDYNSWWLHCDAQLWLHNEFQKGMDIKGCSTWARTISVYIVN